mmetsp:Transcript_56187/g.87501  ORF Transcript_56187/g.87501 Transcript_56187/m.87501 type:complete len:208 (+) Transcript_56187:2135-2758(+)
MPWTSINFLFAHRMAILSALRCCTRANTIAPSSSSTSFGVSGCASRASNAAISASNRSLISLSNASSSRRISSPSPGGCTLASMSWRPRISAWRSSICWSAYSVKSALCSSSARANSVGHFGPVWPLYSITSSRNCLRILQVTSLGFVSQSKTGSNTFLCSLSDSPIPNEMMESTRHLVINQTNINASSQVTFTACGTPPVNASGAV